jgi:uncharacterized membrane protein
MGLRFCNSYHMRIWTAISFYNPGCPDDPWQEMGWWPVEPGTCSLVYANDLADLNQYWYYYADADDGAFWAGPFPASVTFAAFDKCHVGSTADDLQIGFRELDIGDNDDYTLTFVP